MKLDQIKLLKVGDIVVDKVSEAEFVVTGIKEADKLPLCLQLISEIKDPIYLNYVATTTTAYAEKGDTYWIYLSHSIAYGAYSYPTVYTNRRILTCEDLELKETAPWIEPKEPTEEEVVVEVAENADLIPLAKIKELKKSRYAEDLKTISKLIQGNFMVCDLVVVNSRSLRNKVDDKGLIELIKKAGYKVESRENSLVIKGW